MLLLSAIGYIISSPRTLRAQLEKLVANNLHPGGKLIFDTVKGDHYLFCHNEEFLATICRSSAVLGEYRDSQLKGAGVRRIVSFGKAAN